MSQPFAHCLDQRPPRSCAGWNAEQSDTVASSPPMAGRRAISRATRSSTIRRVAQGSRPASQTHRSKLESSPSPIRTIGLVGTTAQPAGSSGNYRFARSRSTGRRRAAARQSRSRLEVQLLIEVALDSACSLSASPPVGDGPTNGKRRAAFGSFRCDLFTNLCNSFLGRNLRDGVHSPHSLHRSDACPETGHPLHVLTAAGRTLVWPLSKRDD